MPIRITQVDAFTNRRFAGNPAAVCVLERPAPADAMQALAFEIGLSETAFVWPGDGGFGLRWFTPVAEVDLCGHATVATAHVLAEVGRLEGPRAHFSTKSGWLEATVEGDEVEIDLPAEVPSPVDPPGLLAARWPVVRAATGRFDLLVELEDEAAVRSVGPTDVELASLPYRGIAVTARADPAAVLRGGAAPDYVLRFFAPRVGVPEDPVTGSAQCLLGPYWAVELGVSLLHAVQLSPRKGMLRVRVDATRVRVGGRASTLFKGEVVGEAADRLTAGS
ncbi:MAG TPA: PhzF family phenazine biosynthesis protein [Acidimicrobiales bacterium]|nr:PhzF family phenazine biosynthesis protein [Acidimicrobiales bacterium]